MFALLIESLLSGLFFWVIGTIIFNLSINKPNKDKNKPYGIDLAFFITGIIICIINIKVINILEN